MSDIRGLWESSTDPTTRFMTAVANKLTKFLTQNQVASVVNDNEDIYSNSVDVENALKFHTLNGQHLFEFDKEYYPTFEPDYDKVTCWIRARNAGSSIIDLSGFNNTAYIQGDPILVDGKQDIGCNSVGCKSLALRLNRTTSSYENQEYLYIRDNENIQTDQLVTGFSEFIGFKIYSVEGQGGYSRTLFEKIDDSTPNYGRMLHVQSDGRIVYFVKDAGVVYAKQTPLDTIIPNTFEDINPYGIFTSYNASTHEIKIYLDSVSQTLTNFTTTVNWQQSKSLHDLCLFRRGPNSPGYTYGDFYDYRLYAEKIVTQQEVTNHFTNKWTIWDVPFGQCMITGHWATYIGSGGAGTPSFSNVSFDPLSFTTD